MSEVRNAILERASKPTKSVARVVTVRINSKTYDVLKEQAELAGVKPSDLVRAAIEAFCAEANETES
jgi:hypothetical protein